jgi:hypothetical protein
MSSVSGSPRPDPDAVYPVRRSWYVRRALGWVTWVCLGLIAFCALVTALFVSAFGHPLAMSIIGFFFALIPIVLLVSVTALRARGAVAAGQGSVGFRLFRRWRLVDVGSVKVARVHVPFGAGSEPGFDAATWGPVGWVGRDGDGTASDGDLIDVEGEDVPPALPDPGGA